MNAVLEEGDIKLLLAAISDVAKARGMSKIASESGLGRESLYKALKPEAKPRFDTIFKVLNSLGLKIGIKAKSLDNNKVRKPRSIMDVSKSGKRKMSQSRPISATIKSTGLQRLSNIAGSKSHNTGKAAGRK